MATVKGAEDLSCLAVFERGCCCSHMETWAQQAFADNIMCGLAEGILGIICHFYFLLSVSNKKPASQNVPLHLGKRFLNFCL